MEDKVINHVLYESHLGGLYTTEDILHQINNAIIEEQNNKCIKE